MKISYSEFYQTFQDLNLDFIGSESLPPNKKFGPSVRENFVIHYITKGKGSFKINDRIFFLKKGDLFILPANIKTIYQADNDNPWSYIWIGISGNTLIEFFYRTHLSENHWHLKNVTQDNFLRHFFQLPHLISQHTLTKDLDIQLTLFFMLRSLILEHPRKSTNQINLSDRYAENAYNYINTNFNKGIKISDVLNHLALSRSYLFSIFKKRYGVSPQHYLINLRMNQAISLLLNSDYSIQMISNAIGYSDSLNFSKAFKKHYGVNPSQFRAENTKNLLIETKTSVNRIKKGKTSLAHYN